MTREDAIAAAEGRGWHIEHDEDEDVFRARVPSHLAASVGQWQPAHEIPLGSVYQWRAKSGALPAPGLWLTDPDSNFTPEVEAAVLELHAPGDKN